jgi:hypothetical protein
MTVALPDLPKAVMDRLRSDADLFGATWTNGRISGNWNKTWPSTACYAVLVMGDTSGGEAFAGAMFSDIPIVCYGPDRRTARALWSLLHAVLIPTDGRQCAFQAARTEVMGVELIGGPTVVPEPDTGWWTAYSVYRFIYGVHPVSP